VRSAKTTWRAISLVCLLIQALKSMKDAAGAVDGVNDGKSIGK
jgi:hypothetical protein